MKPKNMTTNIGFQLRMITTEQFAIIEDSHKSENQDVNLNIGLKFGLDINGKTIAVFVSVHFEQNNNPFIILEIANHFQIDENSWKSFEIKGDKLILPQGFATHLLVLTIGTLRGVLHAKTENTELNKYFLPTINATDMIQEDVELGV